MEVRRTMVPVHQVPRGRGPHADAQPSGRQGPADVSLIGLALTASIKSRALDLGFERVGIGPATTPDHAAAFEAWLDAGYAGTMNYLERGRAERLDPARLLTGARSVVAVALSYKPPADVPSWRGVAAYA